MIVCHCNHIDHREIEEACTRLVEAHPWRVLTPGAVYKALGRRPRCGGCLPLAANLIHTRECGRAERCTDCPLASLVVVEAAIEATIVMVAGEHLEAAE